MVKIVKVRNSYTMTYIHHPTFMYYNILKELHGSRLIGVMWCYIQLMRDPCESYTLNDYDSEFILCLNGMRYKNSRKEDNSY